MAFGLRDSFELMKQVGLGDINEVRVTEGGAKSAVWRQIPADVLRAEIKTVGRAEGAAYSAALLAATGAGVGRCLNSPRPFDFSVPFAYTPPWRPTTPQTKRTQPWRE